MPYIQTPVHTAPRNALRIRRLDNRIRLANLTGNRVPTSVARVLAAALHPGIDSALCRFAATGRLRAELAATELRRAYVPTELADWRDLLGQYLQARIAHQEMKSEGRKNTL